MAKIPFNIKYRPQIESGEYKVVTVNDNHPVKILTFDRDHTLPIIALINRGYDEIYEYDINGCSRFAGDTLYLLTEEDVPHLTKLEELIAAWIWGDKAELDDKQRESIKSYAQIVKDYVREEFESSTEWAERVNNAYANGIKEGIDRVKNIPHWKPFKALGDNQFAVIQDSDGFYAIFKGYRINITKLFDLIPKEE